VSDSKGRGGAQTFPREGLTHCFTRHLEWNWIQVSIAALWAR